MSRKGPATNLSWAGKYKFSFCITKIPDTALARTALLGLRVASMVGRDKYFPSFHALHAALAVPFKMGCYKELETVNIQFL